MRREDIEKVPELTILAESEEAGVFLLMDTTGQKIFVMALRSPFFPDSLAQVTHCVHILSHFTVKTREFTLNFDMH